MTYNLDGDFVTRLREEVASENRIQRLMADAANYIDDLHSEINIMHYEIVRLRERIVELDAFLVIANEQQVAVENENGELRGIIQQAADDVVAASYPHAMHLEWLEAARKVLAEDD